MSLESDTRITENPDTISIEIPTSSQDINLINLSECYSTDSTTGPIKVLLILNQEIKLPIQFFQDLWNQSSLKVCADGGAARLHNYAHKHDLQDELIPDYVVGDLDSLSDTCKQFYTSHGVKIKLQSSQYASDLQKSIAVINLSINCPELDITEADDYDGLEKLETEHFFRPRLESNSKQMTVFAVGAIGGRFDQSVGFIGQVAKFLETRPNMQFVMLNSEYLEFILALKKGKNFITLNKNEAINGVVSSNRINSDGSEELKLRNIGLLPLAGPVVISTEGLKWDVANWNSRIGGAVSSSNLIVGDKGLFVDTSDVLFVNIEF